MKIIFSPYIALYSLQNNDDINGNYNNYHSFTPHLIPGSVQSTSHMVTFFKSHYNFVSWLNAVSILKKKFRKLSDLLSWEAKLVQLKAKDSKSLQGHQKWCAGV